MLFPWFVQNYRLPVSAPRAAWLHGLRRLTQKARFSSTAQRWTVDGEGLIKTTRKAEASESRSTWQCAAAHSAATCAAFRYKLDHERKQILLESWPLDNHFLVTTPSQSGHSRGLSKFVVGFLTDG
jgi:hypothetical protein